MIANSDPRFLDKHAPGPEGILESWRMN